MTRPNAATMTAMVALFFAAVAAWGVHTILKKQTARSATGERATMVVAARDIPLGASIEPGHLTSMIWPKESVPRGAFNSPAILIGRVAVTHIHSGDALTEQKLLPKEGAPGSGVMAYLVPKGHRAVTVSVNEVAGVAGFIAPNNRVDVVLTTPLPRSAAGETLSRIILQNVPVLATGQATEQKEGKPSVVPTVTLDVTPDDAEKLILAANKGSLQLLLRNTFDSAPVHPGGATIAKVLSGAVAPHVTPRTPRTVKLRAAHNAVTSTPPLTVEVIRGKERSTQQFAEQATAQPI